MIKGIEENVVKAVFQGFNEYRKMTDGYGGWVNSTPEYWYTCAIARKLSELKPEPKKDKVFITIENSMSELREYSKSTKVGRVPKGLRKNGRTDIVIWQEANNDWWEPYAIVEVKATCGGKTAYTSDVDRILASMAKSRDEVGRDTIKRGYFVLVSDTGGKNAKANLEKRFKKVVCGIKEMIKDKNSSIDVPSKKRIELIEDSCFGVLIVKLLHS